MDGERLREAILRLRPVWEGGNRSAMDEQLQEVERLAALTEAPPSETPETRLREALDAIDPDGSFWDYRGHKGVLLTNAGFATALAARLTESGET